MGETFAKCETDTGVAQARGISATRLRRGVAGRRPIGLHITMVMRRRGRTSREAENDSFFDAALIPVELQVYAHRLQVRD